MVFIEPYWSGGGSDMWPIYSTDNIRCSFHDLLIDLSIIQALGVMDFLARRQK
jgi:hypothetical protein